MGKKFDKIMKKYDFSYDEMFEYFNKPALDKAIASGKTIRFSHNPLYDDGFLGMEWEHIKLEMKLTDADLIFDVSIWYVK